MNSRLKLGKEPAFCELNEQTYKALEEGYKTQLKLLHFSRKF